jgi:ABC-type transport system substrate-binding protein
MRDVFIGTGPFKFVQWRPDELLEIEAVDQHWRQTPGVKRVRILDIPESSSRTAMIETGEAAIAGELPFKDVVPGYKETGALSSSGTTATARN